MQYVALAAAALFAVLAFLSYRRASQLSAELSAAQIQLRKQELDHSELSADREFLSRAVELALEGRFDKDMLEERRLFEDVDGSAAQSLVEAEDQLVILDVRTPAEHANGHIPDSRLIPVDTLEERLEELPKDHTYLVYCAMGSRSAAAADLLTRKGFARVYNLEAGYGSWPEASQPKL